VSNYTGSDVGEESFKNGISLNTKQDISTHEELSQVVIARGTEDGLILRIDGKAAWESIIAELDAFLGGKKRFFEGGEVSVEWIEKLPTKEQSSELESYLKKNYCIGIAQRKRRLSKIIRNAVETKLIENPNLTKALTEKLGAEELSIDDPYDASYLVSSRSRSANSQESAKDQSPAVESLLKRVEMLAQGEAFGMPSREDSSAFSGARDSSMSRSGYVEKVAKFLGEDVLFDEEANARIVFGTLRSGQRVETPFSLIVIGDVNPGADLIAGGDIVVLGSLRGTAHAGAYEDDTLDRMIVALQMQPMQLRIGSVVSRGSGEAGKNPEVARIDNRMIIVEPYSSRTSSKRGRN